MTISSTIREPVAAAPALASRLDGVASSPVRELLALVGRDEVISFAGGLPAPELFDATGLREAFAHALSPEEAPRSLQYAATEGDARLRARVAERLTAHGLPTGADDLIVTTGSQQALTLIAAALLDPGAVVAVEQPTYLAALQSFSLAGARLVGVAGDDDGLDPDAFEHVCRTDPPTLLYLVPTFANPTGRTLTASRRAAVAEVAARYGVWVVEDNPYGELRYSGEPMAPLAAEPALAVAENGLSLGSFSKIGAPGLRIGWVRAPRTVRRALAIAKQAGDLHTSTIDQAAAARYLEHVDLDAHVAKLVAAYRERRDAMLAELPAVLPEGSTWTRPDGGMFTWVRLPGGVDTAELLPAALERGVAFVPGWPFYAGEPDRSTFRMSFTTYDPARTAEGVRRLAGVFG
jgi:DNA-binding transcriptional MocR family regulator